MPRQPPDHEEWKKHETLITRLYMQDGKSLGEVMRLMGDKGLIRTYVAWRARSSHSPRDPANPGAGKNNTSERSNCGSLGRTLLLKNGGRSHKASASEKISISPPLWKSMASSSGRESEKGNSSLWIPDDMGTPAPNSSAR
jgi:hypothetical protein